MKKFKLLGTQGRWFCAAAMTAVILLSMAVCVSDPHPGLPPERPAQTEQPIQPAPAVTPPPAPTVQRDRDIILDGAQVYTVVAEDTLSGISRQFYGNGFYFPVIMLGSDDTINDPDVIMPGMNLTIPDLRRNLDDSVARARIKSFMLEITFTTNVSNRPMDVEGLRSLVNSL